MSSNIVGGLDPSDKIDDSVRKAGGDAARSKSGGWGPTHSEDSQDESHRIKSKSPDKPNSKSNTSTTKSDTMSSTEQSPARSFNPVTLLPPNSTLEKIFESASAAVDSLLNPNIQTANVVTPEEQKTRGSVFETFVDESCVRACGIHPRVFADSPPRKMVATSSQEEVPPLEIISLGTPAKQITENSKIRVASEVSNDSPMDRRRSKRDSKEKTPPITSITVELEQSNEIARSISELTMRSSYGEATAKVAENRRMAYYAVGKHHKHSGRGGNRRCYFTGKLILGGAPFYAGSVQQGLRTLVVFCLPSAIGLPKEGVDHLFVTNKRNRSDLTGRCSSVSSQGVLPLPRALIEQSNLSLVEHAQLKRNRTRNSSGTSRGTSYDDMSFLEEELDPNWDVDRDYLLQVLPEPSQDLLDEMEVRYPEQFETLPLQVRSPHCWSLFIKFCFFSGLPIAEGEMHYKVVDEIANEVYGEEINLSHEVMEAVNGESAEILRLPNLKTFKYLRKHYTQQSGKLSDAVFQRTSWEMVRPEV